MVSRPEAGRLTDGISGGSAHLTPRFSPAAAARAAGLDAADVAVLVDAARAVAAEAGALVHEGRPDRWDVQAKSSPTDVVTQMDLASEVLLRRRLGELRPDDGFLGEEDGLHPGTTPVTWVVDPVDGTYNYLHGHESYSVSVAAVVGDPTTAGAWTPVAGCVVAPQLHRTWWAGAGTGAYLDGHRLQLEPGGDLATSLVATGFSPLPHRRRAQALVFADLAPHIADLRRCGSAALDLCRVGAGHVGAYYEPGLNPWDVAAGALVAVEAGALVVEVGHGPASGRMLVAGRDGVVAPLTGHVGVLTATSAPTDASDV